MMNLQKAASRFQFRFSKDNKGEFKNFKPNSEDVEALNCIFTEINKRDENTIAKNNLFAKLLVYQYVQNIRHYETTVLCDLNFALKDIHKVLSYPLESFYKGFYEDLHHNQLNQLNKNSDINAGIDNEIDRIRKGDLEIDNFILHKYDGLENYIKHIESSKITDEQQIDIIKSLDQNKKTFTFAYVTDKLNELVTKCYNDFN
jgi:hypothetical protein